MTSIMRTGTAALAAVGVVLTAAGLAHAQMPMPPRPVITVSDIDEPYVALPPGPPPLRRPPVVIEEEVYAPAALIAPTDVYRVLREGGFTPLGIPRQRGPVYTITAINLASGEDGRVVIDGRTGRILRFVPAWRLGDVLDRATLSAATRVLPPMRGEWRARNAGDAALAPRPPAAVPRLAALAPTVKPPAPRADNRIATSALVPRTAVAPIAAQPSPLSEVKAAPQVQPTQAMPAMQGLE